jgi:hypothetical protein
MTYLTQRNAEVKGERKVPKVGRTEKKRILNIEHGITNYDFRFTIN